MRDDAFDMRIVLGAIDRVKNVEQRGGIFMNSKVERRGLNLLHNRRIEIERQHECIGLGRCALFGVIAKRDAADEQQHKRKPITANTRVRKRSMGRALKVGGRRLEVSNDREDEQYNLSAPLSYS